jgi:thiol:disulfide interchange protein DsbC
MKMLKIFIFTIIIGLLGSNSYAQSEVASLTKEDLDALQEIVKSMPVRNKQELRSKLEKKFNTIGYEVGTIFDLPVAGFYEVFLNGEYIYVSRDGQWMVRGDIIDINNNYSLTKKREHSRAVKYATSFGEENMITYKAENETSFIYVYTDTSCHFCKKLHSERGALLDAGVTIKYIPYPRGGNEGPGYQDLVKAWCSDDRNKAMTLIKSGKTNAVSIGVKSADEIRACEDLVISGHQYGNRSGVTGTPRIYTSNGFVIPGYPGFENILQVLAN